MVLDNETIEKEWGWVFFYQNKKYLDTGDFRFMLGGNAPYIVNKYTGVIVVTGTAQDIEHYIEEYERTLLNIRITSRCTQLAFPALLRRLSAPAPHQRVSN